MVEYCLETVNWSPYLGFDQPDLPAMVSAASAAGYKWISFDLPSLTHHTTHKGSLSRLRALMDENGVRMLALHSLAISDDRQRTKELAQEAITAGRSMGALYLHAGVVTMPDAQIAEITREVEAMCNEGGMELAIEFLPFLPLSSIAQTQDLLDAAGLTGRNFVVDSWHFFNGPDDQDKDGWATLASIPASRIAYVQFADHGPLQSDDLLFETTQNRVIPGTGSFDLQRFTQTLRDGGFDGIVGPEILSSRARQMPIEQVAQQLIAATKPYWSA